MNHADFFSSNVDCLKIVKGTLHYRITIEFFHYGSHKSVWKKKGVQTHDVSGKHHETSQKAASDPVDFVDFNPFGYRSHSNEMEFRRRRWLAW